MKSGDAPTRAEALQVLDRFAKGCLGRLELGDDLDDPRVPQGLPGVRVVQREDLGSKAAWVTEMVISPDQWPCVARASWMVVRLVAQLLTDRAPDVLAHRLDAEGVDLWLT